MTLCVPDVYLLKEDKKEKVFGEVENMIRDNEGLIFQNIAGETYRSSASLHEINLVEHMIVLEEKGLVSG